MVAGRKVQRWGGGGGVGGNSPAHLLSFSARFYPAEFLWQPLKKWCAVNCGFEMRRLIAPRAGDGWLFRQPGSKLVEKKKNQSICSRCRVRQHVVLRSLRAHACAKGIFAFESGGPLQRCLSILAPTRLHRTLLMNQSG